MKTKFISVTLVRKDTLDTLSDDWEEENQDKINISFFKKQ